MSAEYKGQDPLDIAKQAERDLNSQAAKGNLRNTSDSANESGVDESVTSKFPGAEVKIGSDGREIPVSEGGEILKETGQ